jgi:mono/diheme cytochrome c family protein
VPKPLSPCAAVLASLIAALVVAAAPAVSFGQDFDIVPEENKRESTVPEPENGAELAQKLCVGCHIIARSSEARAQVDVPTFPEVADRPNQSFDALSAWLIKPHAPMPDLHLSRKEVRDLAGYILSLRTAE